jgi:hypothetical protein
MTDRLADTLEIYALLDIYFEALYQADAEKLGTIIHPDGLYVSTTHEDYLNRSIPEYLDVVRQREAPAKRKDPRNETITSVEFGGPQMAFVRLNMDMLGRRYTDFLTLYKDNKGWKIMTKIFSYNPQGD